MVRAATAPGLTTASGLRGVLLGGRVDLARIARTIDGADLIALQEVERFAARTGMVDQAGIGALPDDMTAWRRLERGNIRKG